MLRDASMSPRPTRNTAHLSAFRQKHGRSRIPHKHWRCVHCWRSRTELNDRRINHKRKSDVLRAVRGAGGPSGSIPRSVQSKVAKERLKRNSTHYGSVLESAAPWPSLAAWDFGFLGSPPTRNVHLVPPGMFGSWPLLAVWDPRFYWAYLQPTFCLLNWGKRIAATRNF